MDPPHAVLLCLLLPILGTLIFFLRSAAHARREVEERRRQARDRWESHTLVEMKALCQWLKMQPRVEMGDDLLLLSQRVLSQPLAAADINAWATACVAAGLDSPGLCSLATVTERDDPRDLAEKLEEGLRELGLARPDKETARLYRGLAIIDRILAHEVAPRAGLEMLVRATEHSSDSHADDPFTEFDELNDRMVAGPRQALDDDIRDAAQRLVRVRERADRTPPARISS